MSEKTYEDGLRDGQLEALEKTVGQHQVRLDAHAQRLQRIERLVYAVAGAAAFIQFLPKIMALVGGP